MPDDSIMDMVNNIESMYNDKGGLFEKWLREGKDWNKKDAFSEARALASHFAEALEGMVRGRYSDSDINEAAREMIEEFVTEELPKWSTVSRKAEEVEKPRPMTEYELEQARKNEALAHEIGFERLKALLPASNEKIRNAILRGDRGLRSIPLRKWDAAATSLRVPGLTLSEKVGLLKHVALWHLD